LIRNLGRPNNGTKERRNRHFIDWFFIFHWNRGFRKTGDEVWNQFPPLCRWPTPALSALASLVLHEIGIPYILSPGACRKGFNDCGKWAQSLMLRNRS
jgi:hypothetical protein